MTVPLESLEPGGNAFNPLDLRSGATLQAGGADKRFAAGIDVEVQAHGRAQGVGARGSNEHARAVKDRAGLRWP